MELSTMSKEDLVIISTMLMEGKTIADVERNFIPSNRRAVIDILHTLRCKLKHSEECKYYVEEDYLDEYRKPWTREASHILDFHGVDETTATKAIGIVFQIEDLITNNVGLKFGAVDSIVRYLLHQMSEDYANQSHEE